MFKLEIETDNAAFIDPRHVELARILREVADKIETKAPAFGPIHDINGNTVGKFNYDPFT